MKYGRLTVIGPSNEKYHLECVCDCGNKKTIRKYDLQDGKTKSCGCLQPEQARKNKTTHSMRRTKIYNVWAGMIARCTNPNHIGYHNYGGRGITVCKTWFKFENFYSDMGEANGLTLDRKNNEKGYSKINCEWVSRKTQGNNRRGNRLITFNGKTQTLTQWADELTIPHSRLQGRQRLGWTIERMLTTP